MRVIVGGAGQVGMHLIDFLVSEDKDVVVIDSSPERIREINDKYEVQAIVGHVSDPETLASAGASPETDIFISVAQSDEVNMVAAQIAHHIFGIQTNIARIRRRSYLGEYYNQLFEDNFPISHVIWPERETAEAIHKSLSIPGVAEAIPMCENVVELIALDLDENCQILNEPLRDLTNKFSDLPITIIAIVRDDELIVPSGKEQLKLGDQIYFCTDKAYVAEALLTFGHELREVNRVVIVGGGQIGTELALRLTDDNEDMRIKIIEENPVQARAVSQIMQGRAMVLRGDGMDMNILEEAGIARADCVLSLTNHEETNILLALLAKRQGGSVRVGALVNHSNYFPLLKALGVDMVISPRDITASNILHYLRTGHVHQAHSIAGGQAEVLETEITPSSPICGKTIKEARFPSGTIVGAVMRYNKMLVPKPDMLIQDADHLVVLSTKKNAKKLQDKFSPFTHNNT